MVGDAQLATVETMENEAMDTGYSDDSGSDYEWTRMVARVSVSYSLGLALRNCRIKKRGPDLARRRAKKNTEPVTVWAVAEKLSPA